MCLKNYFFYQEPHLHVMGKVLKSINGMHKLFVNIVNGQKIIADPCAMEP